MGNGMAMMGWADEPPTRTETAHSADGWHGEARSGKITGTEFPHTGGVSANATPARTL